MVARGVVARGVVFLGVVARGVVARGVVYAGDVLRGTVLLPRGVLTFGRVVVFGLGELPVVVFGVLVDEGRVETVLGEVLAGLVVGFSDQLVLPPSCFRPPVPLLLRTGLNLSAGEAAGLVLVTVPLVPRAPASTGEVALPLMVRPSLARV